MKYRIVRSGDGFVIQCRFRWWPTWGDVFEFKNWFKTIDEAEAAIKLAVSRSLLDGDVVREYDKNGIDIKKPPWIFPLPEPRTTPPMPKNTPPPRHEDNQL